MTLLPLADSRLQYGSDLMSGFYFLLLKPLFDCFLCQCVRVYATATVYPRLRGE